MKQIVKKSTYIHIHTNFNQKPKLTGTCKNNQPVHMSVVTIGHSCGTQYNTKVSIIFPVFLQTIIAAQILSTGMEMRGVQCGVG